MITRRGLAFSFVAVALAFDAAIFHDALVEISLLCASVAVASDWAWVSVASRSVGARLRLESEGQGGERVLFPGDEAVEKVFLAKRIGGEVALEARMPFLKVEPRVVGRDSREVPLEFRFRSIYAGEYVADEVGVLVTGPLGLFSSAGAIRFPQRFVVHPRLVSAARAAARALGRADPGETSVEAPGAGGEFYELRRYQDGDDVRDINWKATARRNQLMVNERAREVGATVALVLDARARGFYDTDRLATTFLSIATGLASSGAGFGVLVHDGMSVTDVSPPQDARQSLEVALGAAVRAARLGDPVEVLELAPAGTSPEPHGGSPSLLAEIREVRRAQLGVVVRDQDPWAGASRFVLESSVRRVVYVSGLSGDLEPLIELAWRARRQREVGFLVVNPTKPSATAVGDEEARRLQARDARLAAALRAAGIEYAQGEPPALVLRALG